MKKFILNKIQKGFTPIELLLVIGISAVVAGLFVFTANSPFNQAALPPININIEQPNVTINPPDVNVNVAAPRVALAPSRAAGAMAQAIAFETVDSSANHTCALTSSNDIKCWGRNQVGQLGDGSTIDSLTPVDVTGLTSWLSVSTGENHTCALTSSGGVKCWGNNFLGQLGDGTITDSHTPIDVISLTSGVSVVSAGGIHTCALTSSSGVKCWGSNGHGQIGNGLDISNLIGHDDFTQGRCSYNLQCEKPVDVTGLTSGVIAISAGQFHTCALTTSNEVKCWGYNGNGQLGDGSTTGSSTPVDVTGLTANVVSAGYAYTCALTTSSGIKCWGYNGNGQLGDGTTTNRPLPTDIFGTNTDTDGDGVPDDIDACPTEPTGGFDADGDGCTDTTEGLVNLINELLGADDPGYANSLAAKTNAAENDTPGAIKALEAAKKAVNAHRRKKLTDAQADALIAYIENLIAQL